MTSYLVLRIVRNKRGEVFRVVPHHDREGWDPHVSHHASGSEHYKSFGRPLMIRRRQKPDQSFVGSENLVTIPVRREGLKVLGRENEFDAIFPIPVSEIRLNTSSMLAVDLAEPLDAPVVTSGACIICQFNINDRPPRIVITLYSMITLPMMCPHIPTPAHMLPELSVEWLS